MAVKTYSRDNYKMTMRNMYAALFAVAISILATSSVKAETSAATSYAVGSGDGSSAEEAFLISNLAELRLLSESAPSEWEAGYYYKLTDDIDASDTSSWNGGLGFSPIGAVFDDFVGTFDGQGHVISGLHIDRTDENYVGLFGVVGSGTTIQNLGLEGGSVSGKNWVGSIAASIDGSISFATVSKCYATANVTGQYDVGGLLGSTRYTTVSSCYATGEIDGFQYVGGLIGRDYGGGTIISCYATGDAPGTSGNRGGLLGINGSEVTACYATGYVGLGTYVGGLVGSNSGTLSSCYWDTETSGTTSGNGQPCCGGTADQSGTAGLTSAQMLLGDSFVGFDSVDTPDWVIVEGVTRPYLQWQTSDTIEGLWTYEERLQQAFDSFSAFDADDDSSLSRIESGLSVDEFFALNTNLETYGLTIEELLESFGYTAHSLSEVWIDFQQTGAEDGTYASPFNTLHKAVGMLDLGSPGNLRFKTGGQSDETIRLFSAMTLTAFSDVVSVGVASGASTP